ncbi:hypothetical protein [Streptomyces tendae]|uniref:hypothetical protein n=1 Tax=Streptomyces tendae TaxID=1932 RepID=UPI0033E75ED4
MIAEAVDTLITLGWAFLAWIAIIAAITTLALWTLTLTVCLTVRALWRLLRPACRPRPAWARTRAAARRYARRPDYDEAA